MYNPVTDFLALIRKGANSNAIADMPGMDFVVSAMARAGIFDIFVGQTAPIVNQTTTVWVKPANPSWTAEATIYLWDAANNGFSLATPALWRQIISPNSYAFQGITGVNSVIAVGTSICLIQRDAPPATQLILPNLTDQWRTGNKLRIADWSTNVTEHAIQLTTPDGATIARQVSWQLFSTNIQLATVELTPVPDVNGWVIQ